MHLLLYCQVLLTPLCSVLVSLFICFIIFTWAQCFVLMIDTGNSHWLTDFFGGGLVLPPSPCFVLFSMLTFCLQCWCRQTSQCNHISLSTLGKLAQLLASQPCPRATTWLHPLLPLACLWQDGLGDLMLLS